MNIVIGGDHAGFALKSELLKKLEEDGHHVVHVGCFTSEAADFPDIAKKVCTEILEGRAQRGIMVCGTGVGAAIACNKVRGIRACVAHDAYSAHQCVEHDDVQVMAIGGQIVGQTLAFELVTIFLNATFNGSEEFRRRVDKIRQMEN